MRTTSLSPVRRLVASAAGAAVALTGLGLGLAPSPAGAVPPGATTIVSNLGYDQMGPFGEHRLDWAPDLDGTPATGYQVERWTADKGQKLFTATELGPVLPTVTFGGMPDEVVYQYRVRTRNADGWGPWSGFEPVKVHTGVSFERPFGDEGDLIERQLLDFFGIATGAPTWEAHVDDAESLAAFLDHLYAHSGRQDRLQVVRLYLAYFDRAPEPEGLDYWEGRLEQGTATLGSVSSFFASSPELAALYGGTTNQQFVTLVYQNVLFRNPAPSEVAYWKGRLDQGTTTRGKLMIGFSESPEGKALREGDAVVADLWATMVREPASNALMGAYGPYVLADGTPGSLALGFLRLDDYVAYYAE